MVNLLLISLCSFADTCPTVVDIKQASLNGWRAYDSDDDTPLSSKRFDQYKSYIVKFVLAEWVTKQAKQPGSIRCYYRDKEGSTLEAYLAKDNLLLQDKKQVWYQVSHAMHCAAGFEACTFVSARV
jgi:hypothetical protein